MPPHSLRAAWSSGAPGKGLTKPRAGYTAVMSTRPWRERAKRSSGGWRSTPLVAVPREMHARLLIGSIAVVGYLGLFFALGYLARA